VCITVYNFPGLPIAAQSSPELHRDPQSYPELSRASKCNGNNQKTYEKTKKINKIKEYT